MKPTAHIEDWYVIGGRLVGKISNHPHQNAFSCDYQMTSTIVKLDRKNNKAETLNTIYSLGKEDKNETSTS